MQSKIERKLEILRDEKELLDSEMEENKQLGKEVCRNEHLHISQLYDTCFSEIFDNAKPTSHFYLWLHWLPQCLICLFCVVAECGCRVKVSENGRVRQVQALRRRTGQSHDSAVEAVRSTCACAERCAQST